MIEKYANKKSISYEYLEDTEFTTILRLEISAKDLSFLSGMHKLVRVSPFGKGDKLHTSLCKVTINGPRKKFLVEVKESDLRIDFFKSTGPGGQHRNKTMSAVRLVHKPTGIIVTSSSSRSQHDNRKYAHEQLQCKLEDILENKEKDTLEKKRVLEKQQEEIVISYYFNHQFVVNEKKSIKSTNLKQILNGDLEIIN